MEVLLYLGFILCAFSSSYAGFPSLSSEHPQVAFCKADFVIRAVVISGPKTEGPYEVFTISIREVFKGLSRNTQERAFGVLDHDLTAKLYTPSRDIGASLVGPFGIQSGTEYFIYGSILQGAKLYTTFSRQREAWSKVTPRQKANLRGYYEAGCQQCQFKPCPTGSDLKCQERLPGCETKESGVSYIKSVLCRKFEHCGVDETGQRCQWKETSESKECQKSPSKYLI